MDRRTALKIAAASAALGWGGFAAANDKFPTHGMRMVVPYPPGGVTDLAGRVVADLLSKKYGQAVVVENKPGANGLIGLQYLASTKPDGYTIALGGLGSNVLPPATIRNLPLDIPNRFVAIAQVAEFINVLVVRADSPYKSVADLLQDGKKRELSYGTNGIGTSSHLATEFFATKTGLKMLHVPYKGSSDILVDVTSGRIDFTFANLPAVAGMVSQGRLRALAVTSKERSKQFPDVPTMIESGVEDFNVTSWVGVYGPAGMPAAIVNQLSNDILEGLALPEFRERLERVNFQMAPLGAADWDRHNKAELERWSSIAKQAGIGSEFGKN